MAEVFAAQYPVLRSALDAGASTHPILSRP